MSKCAYCHYRIIADIQAQVAVEIPEGTAIVHETPCSKLLKREIERDGVLKALAKMSAAILLLIFAFTLKGEVLPQEEWTKGGVVIGIKNDGGCVFKAFVKVGITEDNPDTEEPQILGFEPGNVAVSRKGDVIWERVNEKAFAPLGRFAKFQGRTCKCPPYNL